MVRQEVLDGYKTLDERVEALGEMRDELMELAKDVIKEHGECMREIRRLGNELERQTTQ